MVGVLFFYNSTEIFLFFLIFSYIFWWKTCEKLQNIFRNKFLSYSFIFCSHSTLFTSPQHAQIEHIYTHTLYIFNSIFFSYWFFLCSSLYFHFSFFFLFFIFTCTFPISQTCCSWWCALLIHLRCEWGHPGNYNL